jgi:hypothetical protein
MKGRLITGILVIALGLAGCGSPETAEAVVTTAVVTTAVVTTATATAATSAAATFDIPAMVETTVTAAETLLTTTPVTTTAYIRGTSNDIAFSGEINADPLEYIKMLNISSGYGYMAFDDEYFYYAGNDDNENHARDIDTSHQIYKTALDGVCILWYTVFIMN